MEHKNRLYNGILLRQKSRSIRGINRRRNKVMSISTINIIEKEPVKLNCIANIRRRVRKVTNGKFLSDNEIKSIMESIKNHDIFDF